MRKSFRNFCGFFLFTVLFLFLFLLLLRTASSAPSGTAFGTALQSEVYTISELRYDEEAKEYHFDFSVAEGTGNVALIVSDAVFYDLIVNDAALYSHGPNDRFERMARISLPVSENGRYRCVLSRIASGADDRQIKESAQVISPKILVGSEARISRIIFLTLGLTMFAIGLQTAFFFSCLTMFREKTEETYLLIMAAVAVLCVIRTFLTSSLPILPITEVFYLKIRRVLISSVDLSAAVIFVCLMDPPKASAAMKQHWKALLLGLGALCALNYAFDLTNMTKAAAFIAVLLTFSGESSLPALQKWVLGGCYAAGYGLSLLMVLITAGRVDGAGVATIVLRILYCSSIVFVAPCMYVVNSRFASRFSDAQRLGREVEQMNATLEARIAERTGELREEQRKKHELMTNIFHDLRSPIFVLKQRVEELKKSCTDEASLRVLSSRLSYLEHLAEDLFLVAKLENAEDIFDMDDTDVSGALERIVDDARPTAQSEGITLLYEGETACVVWGDAFRLSQAFQNLVDNALRHTGRGGTIRVAVCREGDCCVVRVADNGRGIAPDQLETIFERYYHCDRRDTHSSGLGLSIAKKIVEAHRGSIQAQSAAGRGSTFTVRLPLVENEEE